MNADQLADKFIALANELAEQEQNIGKVSDAIRYAAARYNAFEASLKTDNLERDREDAIQRFTSEYQRMLIENIDEMIENDQKRQSQVN